MIFPKLLSPTPPVCDKISKTSVVRIRSKNLTKISIKYIPFVMDIEIGNFMHFDDSVNEKKNQNV